MRLTCEVCRERSLPAIINTHDVFLAQMFVDRIVGLRAGSAVFGGSPDALDETVLTQIYGEEDWNQMRKDKDADIEDEKSVAAFEAARADA